jgi:hypothetical protein
MKSQIKIGVGDAISTAKDFVMPGNMQNKGIK